MIGGVRVKMAESRRGGAVRAYLLGEARPGRSVRVAEGRPFVHSGGQFEGLSEKGVELGLDQHAVGVGHLRKDIFPHTAHRHNQWRPFDLRTDIRGPRVHSQRSLSTSFPPHSVASMAFTDSTTRRLSGSLQHTSAPSPAATTNPSRLLWVGGGGEKRLPVDGGQQELNQQGGAFPGIDGVGGREALAELVEEGGHQVLQPGGGDDGAQLDGVQARVSDGLDHVVDVDQVDWNGDGRRGQRRRARLRPRRVSVLLTVASLLDESELAGRPIRRQTDGVEVLLACDSEESRSHHPPPPPAPPQALLSSGVNDHSPSSTKSRLPSAPTDGGTPLPRWCCPPSSITILRRTEWDRGEAKPRTPP